MTLYYYEQVNQINTPLYDVNFLIVMATLFAADVSSWSVGTNRSGSIRELDTHPAVKFFFSFMQFGATSGCLYGLRRYSIMFYMAFIVQSTYYCFDESIALTKITEPDTRRTLFFCFTHALSIYLIKQSIHF
jgi:hypothetical protein